MEHFKVLFFTSKGGGVRQGLCACGSPPIANVVPMKMALAEFKKMLGKGFSH